MYLSQPLIFAILHSWPNTRRLSTVVGLLVMCVALAASSFSKNTTHLILTQGVLNAIGGSVAYAPTILFVDEWFVRRKGFAYAVMWVSRDILVSIGDIALFADIYPPGWHRPSWCSLTACHGMGSQQV